MRTDCIISIRIHLFFPRFCFTHFVLLLKYKELGQSAVTVSWRLGDERKEEKKKDNDKQEINQKHVPIWLSDAQRNSNDVWTEYWGGSMFRGILPCHLHDEAGKISWLCQTPLEVFSQEPIPKQKPSHLSSHTPCPVP